MSRTLSPLSVEQELQLVEERAYRIVKRWRSLTIEQQISLVKKACAKSFKAESWDEKAVTDELWERLSELRRKLPKPKRNRTQEGHIVLVYVGGKTPKNNRQPTTEYILDKNARKVQPSTEYRPAIEHTEGRRRETERARDMVYSILQAVDLVSSEDRKVLEGFLNVALPRDTINSIAVKLGMDRTELRRVLDRARRLAEVKVFASKGHAVAVTQPMLIGKLIGSIEDFPPATKPFLLAPDALPSAEAWKAAAAPVASDTRYQELPDVDFPRYSRDWYDKALRDRATPIEIRCGEILIVDNQPSKRDELPNAEPVNKAKALRRKQRLLFERWNEHRHTPGGKPCGQCAAHMAEIKRLDEEVRAITAEVAETS